MAARQTFYAESNTESTYSTDNVFQVKVTLAVTPDANSDYFVFGCALLKQSSGSQDTRAKLLNTTSAVTFNSVNIEFKDTSDYVSWFGATKETFGVGPAEQTYNLQYSTETAGAIASIKEARILVLKKDAADEYAESLGDSTATSGTTADKVTLTYTPASEGLYTFIFVADMNVNSATGEFNAQLDIDGVVYAAQNPYVGDSTTYRSVMGVVPNINLTAASHTIKLQFASDGVNTTTIRNAKIIALRHSVMNAAQTVHQTTRQTRTATTYADVTGATLTFTPAAVEHIHFASSVIDNSGTSTSSWNQLLEDATVIAETLEEPVNTSGLYPFLTFYRKTLAAASTTWAFQHKTESTATVGSDELAIAIFQTAVSDTTIGGFDEYYSMFIGRIGEGACY